MSDPQCSIVIRTFNEEKHIGRLLTGILEQSIKDVEIILVDSGSSDATVSIAKRFPVRILSIDPGDFTFGRSLNLGCSQAQGKYIVIASGHVYPVYPDWLECLIAPFKDPAVALTYGKQRGNHLTKFVERQIFATWFPEVSNYQQSHPFCNNANAAIRKELWERHPYDETLAGLEDLDWANWAISEQYVLAYNAEAEVIHVHEERPGQVYNRYRREAMALKRIQPQAKFRFVDFLRLFFSNIVSDCWHAIRARLLTKEIEGIIWFRFMQFWGTYRGFAISGDLTSQLKRTFYYPRGFRERAVEEQREISPINYPGVRTRNQDQDD